ncbi:general substrate transporter [Gilbertella persicaria]|uniref:general substrate transporter n=1 Tax=Gilbertella persicaria TaxID=101096 RepID=UPI00221E671B|nr:general substrate transporter [Gilbertella persicaria]KAI8092143.1 general substrate transporter [Gilbertella persicaria]
MPERVIIGVVNDDESYHCLPGTNESGPLVGCLPMDSYTWGYTIGAFAIGGFFGSLASKYLNVWFGRRDNIMISCIWMILGGILSACAINLGMYSVGRAFVGFASGMCGSSVAIYVSEISTNKSRGALGSLFELFLNLGILLTQICGRYMAFAPAWRFLWAIPTVLSAVQLACLYFFTVECPRRLCANKKYDEACNTLQKLRSGADVEEEFGTLLAARQREAESAQKQMSIWDIVSCKDRHISWNTVIVMVIQAFNQIGGIGPMSVYSVGFFTTIFGDATLATNISLADASVNILATLIAVVFMHKVGRKGFMLISTGGTCIASVMMVLGSTLENSNGAQGIGGLAIAAAILFTGSYSMGCGVIPWLIAPELLPMHALAAGSALGNSSNWLFNFVINTVWPHMNQGLGTYSFIVFVVINLFGFLFLAFFMPETTGHDLDQHKKKAEDVEKMDVSSDNTLEKPQHFDHV